MIDALLAILGMLTVGNVVYDKMTILALRRESIKATAALLEASGEKRAAATVRSGEPAPSKGEPANPLHRPQQVGLGRRPS